MALTSREAKGKAILIGVGIIILVAIIVFFVWGANSILKAILWFVEFLMFLGVLFLLAYLFWYLFIKQQAYDVNYVNKMRLLKACTLVKRPLLKDLYLTGDKGHSRALVGTIVGYCRIKVLSKKYLFTEETDGETGKTIKKHLTIKNDRGEDVKQFELETLEQDVFAVKPKGALGMFSEPMVIRCSPSSHDELVGDVNLAGYSLIPISEYFFLNDDMLDTGKVSHSILWEAQETLAYKTMTEFKLILDRGIGLDAKHQKGIEAKSLVELPEVNQQQQR
jgi:hypothetical protein